MRSIEEEDEEKKKKKKQKEEEEEEVLHRPSSIALGSPYLQCFELTRIKPN